MFTIYLKLENLSKILTSKVCLKGKNGTFWAALTEEFVIAN